MTREVRRSPEQALEHEQQIYRAVGQSPYLPLVIAQQLDPLVLILEWFPRNSMDKWLFHGPARSPQADVPLWLGFNWLRQFGLAGYHFWANGYVFVDWKPANVLVHGDRASTRLTADPAGRLPFLGAREPGAIALCDLGGVVGLNRPWAVATKGFAPPEYRITEVVNGQRHRAPATLAGELFGLGATMFSLIMRNSTPPSDWSAGEIAAFLADQGAAAGYIGQLVGQLMDPDPSRRLGGSHVPTNPAKVAEALQEQIIASMEDAAKRDLLGELILALDDPDSDETWELT